MAAKKDAPVKLPINKASESPLPLEPVRKWLPVQIAFVLPVLVVLIAICWARPRACGDFYVGLAAGRDMAESGLSSLTSPDTWSFLTGDRIWFNQNWGCHMMFYGAWWAGGEMGEMILKAGLLLLIAFFIVMRCRQRKVSWPVAILVGGVSIGAVQAFVDMRPNLMTLTFSPLIVWLLLRSRKNVHNIWFAAAAALLWANVHGGFIFGLGMLGLWAVCWIGAYAVRMGPVPALKKYWPFPAAVLGGILLAGIITPFGIDNLTHVLQIGGSEKWREISEWRSIHKGNFGSTWEFLTLMSIMVGLAIVSVILCLATSRKKRALPLNFNHVVLFGFSMLLSLVVGWLLLQWSPIRGERKFFVQAHRNLSFVVLPAIMVGVPLAMILFSGLRKRGGAPPRYRLGKFEIGDVVTALFELILAALVIFMAIKSRRFIPLAFLLVVPLVAVQIEWFYRLFYRLTRQWWLLALPAAALLIPALMGPAPGFIKHYDSQNPTILPLTTFQRMVLFENYPHKGVEFLRDNGVTGRIFHDWRWEGFLHWQLPELELFVGGRAQQVYRLDEFELFQRIMGGHDVKMLERLEFDMITLNDMPQSGGRYKEMVKKAVWNKESNWVFVFWNNSKYILANTKSSRMQPLIEKVLSGEAKYPSEAIKAMSRAMCMRSIAIQREGKTSVNRVIRQFKKAIALHPTREAYGRLFNLWEGKMISDKDMSAYLESEIKRLDQMPTQRAGGRWILECRAIVGDMLVWMNKQAGNNKAVAEWQLYRETLRGQFREMREQWRR